MTSLFIAIFLILSCFGGQIWCRDETGVPNNEHDYTINNKERLDIVYPAIAGNRPYRIEVSSEGATREAPILIVVRQEKHITSWQLPLIVTSSSGHAYEYQTSARTLCHSHEECTRTPVCLKTNFTLTLSTSSAGDLPVKVHAYVVENFIVEPGQTYNATFSPSQPVFFVYNYPDQKTDNVQLRLHSDDNVCFVASIQPNICPIYDLNDEIAYQGRYMTVIDRGGHVVQHKDRYLQKDSSSFVVVFVAKPDNAACQTDKSTIQFGKREKQQSVVEFSVSPPAGTSLYLEGTLELFLFNLLFCFGIALATWIFYKCKPHHKETPNLNLQEVKINDGEVGKKKKTKRQVPQAEVKTTKSIAVQTKKDNDTTHFFLHIVNSAIFYAIPAIQLMLYYLITVKNSGNLDTCYFNGMCSHPLFVLDFNHVYSNIGYVMFGLLFIAITRFRQVKCKCKPGYGLPKSHGVYYSMGIAMIVEGILSASYHICPNKSNFQFDTSFMYVMAIMIMVKLYQNRHPKIYPNVYTTFIFLGVSIIFAIIGLLYFHVAYHIFFVLYHVNFVFDVYYSL